MEVKDSRQSSDSLADPGTRCQVVTVSQITSGILASLAHRSQEMLESLKPEKSRMTRGGKENICFRPEVSSSLKKQRGKCEMKIAPIPSRHLRGQPTRKTSGETEN